MLHSVLASMFALAFIEAMGSPGLIYLHPMHEPPPTFDWLTYRRRSRIRQPSAGSVARRRAKRYARARGRNLSR